MKNMENERRLKIAYITASDPHDKRSWSGSIFCIAQSLQKHCGDVYYLGPLNPLTELIPKTMHRFFKIILKKNYSPIHSKILSQVYARMIQKKLSDESFDLIFAPFASAEIAYLNTDIPIVYLSDATLRLLSSFPDYFPNWMELSKKEGEYLESAAITKADLILYTSQWAADSALKDYGADKSIVHVIPMGANMDDIPSAQVLKERKKSDECGLLFIGVDWVRKGGEIAFETMIELQKMEIPTKLVVCGCVPPEEFQNPHLEIIAFLDKNDAEQRKELEKLFLQSDFLILPSRSEAFGIVICEASAYGLPSIATITGGIPEIIDSGKNGFLMPLEAGGLKYAEQIKEIYQDPQKYHKMEISSRKTYDEKLNWDNWGKHAKKLIDTLLKEKKQVKK